MKMLKSKLPILNPNRVKVLGTKAGATTRWTGRKLTNMRKEVLREGSFQCVDCGRVGLDHEIDHEIPLEQGGTYDRANLKVRCVDCHKAKTARDAKARVGKGDGGCL